MHELENLKSLIIRELKEYGKRESLSRESLPYIDTLAHAGKNLCKLIDGEEMSYDGGMSRGRAYYDPYDSYDGSNDSYDGGMSNIGRKRDSMGRYSSRRGYYEAADEVIEKLKEMMQNEKDESTRQEYQRFISKLEKM